MPSAPVPIAILCSDLHLSDTPPIYRSTEKLWHKRQASYLQQLGDTARHHGHIPIVIAGDLFDKYNPAPRLINMALEHLPNNVYAIPGQHDLYMHNYADIENSAYWTLVKAKKITNIVPDVPLSIPKVGGDHLVLHGFPWGHPVHSRKRSENEYETTFHLAVVHSYIWTGDYSYSGAPREQCVKKYRKNLDGYHAAVFGDNHKGFLTRINKQSKCKNLLNCGTFMRRHSVDAEFEPRLGILFSDGNIKLSPLDTSVDKYYLSEDIVTNVETGSLLLENIAGLFQAFVPEQTTMNFLDVIRTFVISNPKLSKGVSRILLELINERS